MKHRLPVSWLALLGSALLVPVLAQAESPAPVNPHPTLIEGNPAPSPDDVMDYKLVDATTEKRVFRLKYIQPSLVAWWLDPQRAPLPMMVQQSLAKGRVANPIEGFRPEAAHLTPDIARLEIYSSLNRLVAYGNATALDKLATVIETIDKPLSQAEFNTQFVQVSAQEARKLQLWPVDDFQKGKRVGSTGLAFGLVPFETRQRVLDLIRTKRAIVLNSPRMTVTSGLTDSMFSKTALPIPLDGVPPQGKPAAETKNPRVAYISLSEGITLHPIIQPDDAVRVDFDVMYHAFSSQVSTFDMRESDTIAFQFPSSQRGKVVIALTTFRLTRRSVDKQPASSSTPN